MRFNPFVPHGPEPFTPIPRSGGPVPSVIEFFKRKIDELFKRDSASVHYTPEEKTDEEKAIARDNIRAQEKLVSGVNLKTVRGQSLLGSGDVPQVPAEWGGIMGNLGMQTDLVEALGGKADRSDVYTKSETDAKITANVENSVTSTSTTKALSANMGKELQAQITNLKQRGRYLSIWDCTTGLAKTEPTVNPYEYKAGDYFIVGTVGTTNYRPSGTSYDKTVPSTTVETGSPIVNDTYYFDGTSWSLLHTEQPEISWGSIPDKPSTFPPEDHTHVKSEITDFPASMPPTAHSHANDNWFTTALGGKLDKSGNDFVNTQLKVHDGMNQLWVTGNRIYRWTDGGDAEHSPQYTYEFPDNQDGTIALTSDIPDVSAEIYTHNTDRSAHADIRSLITQTRSSVELAHGNIRDLQSNKLDKTDVVDPHDATEEGKAADALATKTALASKAEVSHTHAQSDVTGLDEALASKIGADDVKRVYNAGGTQYIDGDGGVYTADVELGGHWTLKQLNYTYIAKYKGRREVAGNPYYWVTDDGNRYIYYTPETGKISINGNKATPGAPANLNPEHGADFPGTFSYSNWTAVFTKQQSVFPSEPQDTIAKKSELDGKADEVKPSFSTITLNGVDYTEWALGTRSGLIMLSVDIGGVSTEIAAFNAVSGVFRTAPGPYRDTLRFDGKAPVIGVSPTLFDHVARESALDGKANASDFSTSTPASYVTDFVQQSAILQERIKSVAQSLIRTAFANFDPNEQSFADLVNILKNIGA